MQWHVLRKNTALVLMALCLGLLIGSVTSYQYFDIKLTEGSGDLLGAAVGAFLAVSLAAYLDGRKEGREREAMRQAVAGIFNPLLITSVDGFASIVQNYRIGAMPAEAVLSASSSYLVDIDRARIDFDTLLPVFSHNALDLLAYRNVIKSIGELKSEVQSFKAAFTPTFSGWNPPPRSGADASTHMVLIAHLKKALEGVGREH